jgi:hypothetical protein
VQNVNVGLLPYLCHATMALAQSLDYEVRQVSTEERNGDCCCDLSGKNIAKSFERPEERRSNEESRKKCRHEHIDAQGCRIAFGVSAVVPKHGPYSTYIRISHKILGNHMI